MDIFTLFISYTNSYVTTIKYIMYDVQDYSVDYTNLFDWLCEG